jgi:hypothetical protein
VKSSFGYTGTRLDLQGVAGTAIKIRFRIGTDIAVGSLGWLLDNIGIYECVGVPAITFQPANQTTNSGASAVLNVAATGGSLNYQWYAGSAGTTTNPVGTNSSAFATPPLNGLVRYWVRVSNSFGSTDSSAATIFVTFTDAHTVTDSTLTTGVTPVRAVHVLELRTRIDALRVANALGAFPWTNATLSVHTTVIAPVDIAELRTALTAVYTARSLPTPTFTGAITTGTVIRALHIAELRNAVTAIEP